MKFIFEKNTTLFYILSAILLTTVLSILYLNNQKEIASSKKLLHNQEVISKSNEVLLDVLNIETGFRGYLLSGKNVFLEPYNRSKNKVNANLDTLDILTKDNPNQQNNISLLKKKVADRLDFTEKYLAAKSPHELSNSEKIGIIEEGKRITDKIRETKSSVTNEEFKLLKNRKIENEKDYHFSELIFFLLLVFLAVIFILVMLIIKNQKKTNYELETHTASQMLASQYALSLIEASLDPLVTINTEGKITDMNEATVNITGMTREELKGSDFFDYFTEPQMAREVYQEVFAKGSVADSPLTLRHKKGKLTDVLFNGSVYKDDKGNVMGVVIVARDVTDQKRIERELIEARVFAELATGIAEEAQAKAESSTKTAIDAVKAKQQFLSNMSHEIRTPMNAIIGFTKVVLKTDLSSKQREYLSAIKMSGDALIVLINDILDLAKVDAGKMTFEQVPFKMEESIKAMLHIFEAKIQEKNVKLVSQYDKNIPDVLLGDSVRLHQIILNLVSNAVKFTAKGKITVSVRLLSQDEDKVTVEFEVSDTGIGISEEKLGGIFENFQQASSNTSRLYGGTGLGLAIVKQLVEPQGGTITVKSKMNEGSTFSFVLDFLKTNALAEMDTALLELDTENRSIKVLVVEDMALNQLLMKTLLDDFGFERDIADNGQIAVEKLQANTYDVVLMDLQMPIMNGFEATEYIRNTLKLDIPIIALTADVTTVDLAKCKSVGMNDYIAKPVDERLLFNKIIGLVKIPVLQKDISKVEAEIEEIEDVATKYTNLDYLKVRTKSNPKLMMEMISIYLQQTPPLLEAMTKGVLNKDWPLLAAAAHKIIPSFAIMGMSHELENTAKQIQEAANAEQFTDENANMVVQLESICRQACQELELEFNLIKNT